MSWSVRHGSSTVAAGAALVLFSLLLVGSEAARVILRFILPTLVMMAEGAGE